MDILKHGEDVEVLSPNDLKKKVSERLKRACALY
jgi:predicted DNA-binding transcriptional regulator YafY